MQRVCAVRHKMQATSTFTFRGKMCHFHMKSDVVLGCRWVWSGTWHFDESRSVDPEIAVEQLWPAGDPLLPFSGCFTNNKIQLERKGHVVQLALQCGATNSKLEGRISHIMALQDHGHTHTHAYTHALWLLACKIINGGHPFGIQMSCSFTSEANLSSYYEHFYFILLLMACL